ncbi:MAG TPA: mitofilin family membrane protein [Alphaproteobacteria bacterium]|nr:mitofilin family membrane protein [Alphaproteobacteria bacterium]HNS43908.1 mitofilin family membrane protein [Alphaproteobacteria bacterium]
MTTEHQDNIGNAVEIIERFGGIRPMATKMGVAVTTIQGWKQRNSIPSNRCDDLLKAAKVHGVVLDDLLGGETLEPVSAVKEKEIPLGRPAPSVSPASSDEFASPSLQMQSQKTTLLIAGVLIIAAAVVGIVFAMAPKVQHLTEQEQRIRELEAQVQAMKEAKPAEPLIPEEYKQSLTQLQSRVSDLAAQAQNYKGVVDDIQRDLQSGNMQQRLSKIEGHIQTMVAQAKAVGLQDMIAKVQMMQSSPEGAAQLGDVVRSLLPVVQLPEGATDENFAAALQQLKDSDPKVAETFKDVAPEDMKAAVMLVGMSQLRSSLARDNQSFETDLTLLKATMAKDDPELAAAIDRLAPKAKSGVLTPDGLSNEFRSLAGDVVAASLAGENVSVQDKALARFGNLVTVEKDGKQISGTDTQIRVAEAQKLLDQGDIEGAVAVLQQIEGPAAEKTQPFIDQAQATMMARQVQQMLGTNLLMKLKSMAGGARGGAGGAYIVKSNGLDGMMAPFKSIIPEATQSLPKGGAQ